MVEKIFQNVPQKLVDDLVSSFWVDHINFWLGTRKLGRHIDKILYYCTTLSKTNIQEPLKLGLFPSQGNQIVFQFFHVFRGKCAVRFTEWSINRCPQNVLQTVRRRLHQLQNRPSCLAEVFVQAAWMKGQWKSLLDPLLGGWDPRTWIRGHRITSICKPWKGHV